MIDRWRIVATVDRTRSNIAEREETFRSAAEPCHHGPLPLCERKEIVVKNGSIDS